MRNASNGRAARHDRPAASSSSAQENGCFRNMTAPRCAQKVRTDSSGGSKCSLLETTAPSNHWPVQNRDAQRFHMETESMLSPLHINKIMGTNKDMQTLNYNNKLCILVVVVVMVGGGVYVFNDI